MVRTTSTRHMLDTEYLLACVEIKREELGLNWIQTARQIGMSDNGLYRLRKTTRAVHVDTLASILTWLGVTDITPFLMKRPVRWT